MPLWSSSDEDSSAPKKKPPPKKKPVFSSSSESSSAPKKKAPPPKKKPVFSSSSEESSSAPKKKAPPPPAAKKKPAWSDSEDSSSTSAKKEKKPAAAATTAKKTVFSSSSEDSSKPKKPAAPPAPTPAAKKPDSSSSEDSSKKKEASKKEGGSSKGSSKSKAKDEEGKEVEEEKKENESGSKASSSQKSKKSGAEGSQGSKQQPKSEEGSKKSQKSGSQKAADVAEGPGERSQKNESAGSQTGAGTAPDGQQQSAPGSAGGSKAGSNAGSKASGGSTSSKPPPPPPPPPEQGAAAAGGINRQLSQDETTIEEVIEDDTIATKDQPIVTTGTSGYMSDTSLTHSTDRRRQSQIIEEGGEMYEVIEEEVVEEEETTQFYNTTYPPQRGAMAPKMQQQQRPARTLQPKRRRPANLSVGFRSPHVTDLLEYRQALDSSLSVNIAVHVAKDYHEVPWYEQPDYQELPWYMQADFDEADAITDLSERILLASENKIENKKYLDFRAMKLSQGPLDPASVEHVTVPVANNNSATFFNSQVDGPSKQDIIAAVPTMPVQRVSSLLFGPQTVSEDGSSVTTSLIGLEKQRAFLSLSERPSSVPPPFQRKPAKTTPQPQVSNIWRQFAVACEMDMDAINAMKDRYLGRRSSMVDSGRPSRWDSGMMGSLQYSPISTSQHQGLNSPASQQIASPVSIHSPQSSNRPSEQFQQSGNMATPFQQPQPQQPIRVMQFQQQPQNGRGVPTTQQQVKPEMKAPVQRPITPKQDRPPDQVDVYEMSSGASFTSGSLESSDPMLAIPIYARVVEFSKRFSLEPSKHLRSVSTPLTVQTGDDDSGYSVPFDEPEPKPEVFQDEYYEPKNTKRRDTTKVKWKATRKNKERPTKPRKISRKLSRDPPEALLTDPQPLIMNHVMIPERSPIERNLSAISNVSSIRGYEDTQILSSTAAQIQPQQSSRYSQTQIVPVPERDEMQPAKSQRYSPAPIVQAPERTRLTPAKSQFMSTRTVEIEELDFPDQSGPMTLSQFTSEEKLPSLETLPEMEQLPGTETNAAVQSQPQSPTVTGGRKTMQPVDRTSSLVALREEKKPYTLSQAIGENLLGIGICFCLIAVWVVVLVVTFGDIGAGSSSADDGGSGGTTPTAAPSVPSPTEIPDATNSSEPTASPTPIPQLDGSEVLPSYSWDAIQRDGDSPQWHAWNWLLEQDLEDFTDDELLQRFAVASFAFSTSSDPDKSTPNWINSGSHECTWYDGIVCDGNQVIQQFDFRSNNLGGSIPNEIGILTNLIRLDLGDNPQLRGSIPTTIGLLTDLQGISLDLNDLTGPIPTEVGRLSLLKWLTLAGQGNIEETNTARNSGGRKLSGTIPTTLGLLTNLQHIRFEDNAVTGKIPPELGNISSLQTLVLRRNQLVGAIPPSLGSLQELQGLALESNQLTGELPEELSRLPSLIELRVQDNQMNGMLPASLDQLSNTLVFLTVSENDFVGPVPRTWSSLSKLQVLQIEDNVRLTGTIPDEWGVNWPELMRISLQGTSLIGEVPAGLCFLKDDPEFALDSITIDCDNLLCTCGCECL